MSICKVLSFKVSPYSPNARDSCRVLFQSTHGKVWSLRACKSLAGYSLTRSLKHPPRNVSDAKEAVESRESVRPEAVCAGSGPAGHRTHLYTGPAGAGTHLYTGSAEAWTHLHAGLARHRYRRRQQTQDPGLDLPHIVQQDGGQRRLLTPTGQHRPHRLPATAQSTS